MRTRSQINPPSPPSDPVGTAAHTHLDNQGLLAKVGVDDLNRLLVEGVLDYAIYAISPTGRVLTWNAGAQRLKGYTADEIMGEPFTKFYPPDALARGWPQHELEVAAREGRFEDEGWRVRKDGSRFWAHVVLTALRDASGELVGFAKLTRDLTARREAEQQREQRLAAEAAARVETRRREELQAALERAEAAREEAARSAAAMVTAYRELDQFAYIASHDLKAPLRGIANLAQWIQEDLGDQLSAESATHLRLLQGRVYRMEALIDGILAFSRAGRRLTKPEPVDTGVLVHEVIELLAPGPDVTFQVAAAMPTVEAERVPLQQVFLNLIGNAVKYARAHRPDAVVGVTWREAENGVTFSIRDNGPGIAPEFHDRIWGMFQTLEPRDKVEGTGIGLSVVKKIVETRGGRAWVESSAGHGATFHFTWPGTARPGIAP